MKSILNTPPGTPSEGDRYLIDTAPTAAWVGHAKAIATFNGIDWDFAASAEGWFVYDCDTNARQFYTGSAWEVDPSAGEINTASNQNTGGVGVFYQKSGVDLQFKGIIAASSKVSVTDATGTHNVSIDVAEANIVHNNLSGFAAANHRLVNWNAATGCIEVTI